MTREQLQLIESELGIVLPADYQEAALSGVFPKIGEDYFIDDVEQVLKENRECRARGFFGLQWQPHYFLFGADRDGSRYFFDLLDSPPSIWFANRESGERELETDSFAEWLQFALEDEKRDEEDRAEDEAEAVAESLAAQTRQNAAVASQHEFAQITNTKAWWQFWK